jgi:hypothetical protein
MWFWNLLGNVIGYAIAFLISAVLGALCAGIFWIVIGHPKDRLALVLTALVLVTSTFLMAGDHVFPTVERWRKRFNSVQQ